MGAIVVIIGILVTLHRGRRDGLVMPRAMGWIGKAVVVMAWLAAITPPGSLLVGAALAPVALLLLAPAPILRRGVVPLGLPRLAYWAARIASPIELINDSGLGACYGALAVRRAGAPQRSIAWLTERIDRARFPRGPGVLAAGLLAAARGDLDTARALIGCADALDRRLMRSDVRVIARDWLVADAAHHGDWRAVIRLGRRGWRSLRWSYVLARLGERLVAAPTRGHAAVLCLCWIVAPRRRATFRCFGALCGRRARRCPMQRPRPACRSRSPIWPSGSINPTPKTQARSPARSKPSTRCSTAPRCASMSSSVWKPSTRRRDAEPIVSLVRAAPRRGPRPRHRRGAPARECRVRIPDARSGHRTGAGAMVQGCRDAVQRLRSPDRWGGGARHIG